MGKKTLRGYLPPNPSLWHGRADSLPFERFFQKVQCHTWHELPSCHSKNDVALIGFASDEGIRRNDGRIGAALAPDEIRQALGKLACHQSLNLHDLGTIECKEHFLEEATEHFSHLIQNAHQQGYKTLVLGGGHEIALGHYLGLHPVHSGLGIINFDAHFDLRMPQNQQLTSGTSFWQIHQYLQEQHCPFQYCVLGIQPTANTHSLYQAAHEMTVPYLEAHQIQHSSLGKIQQWIKPFLDKVDKIYLTLCMDVFAQAYAPGVSAPQPLGLAPQEVLPFLRLIIESQKVVAIDIVETSPPLDSQQQTIKLAASLAAFCLEQWANT